MLLENALNLVNQVPITMTDQINELSTISKQPQFISYILIGSSTLPINSVLKHTSNNHVHYYNYHN
jgi:hypothetical protein